MSCELLEEWRRVILTRLFVHRDLFPSLGCIDPGDLLFFDPSEYHMILSRCRMMTIDEIYCVSFYLKSNLIGGNDNSYR